MAMKIIFLDIETVPTDLSLQENGLLEPQIQLNETELIKKLSLSAATAKILCLCYAIEPSTDTEVQVLQGEETEIIKGFWKLAVGAHPFPPQQPPLFPLSFILPPPSHPSKKPAAFFPLSSFQNRP